MRKSVKASNTVAEKTPMLHRMLAASAESCISRQDCNVKKIEGNEQRRRVTGDGGRGGGVLGSVVRRPQGDVRCSWTQPRAKLSAAEMHCPEQINSRFTTKNKV